MANTLDIRAEPAAANLLTQTVHAGAGGWAAGDYVFVLVTWYDEDEEREYLAGTANYIDGNNGEARELIASGSLPGLAIASGASIEFAWAHPTRGGATVSDVHHYAIYKQTSNVGAAYAPTDPGLKMAVVGYADGNIPRWLTGCTVLNGAGVTPLARTAAIRKFDTTRNAIWIDGDHRTELGKGTGYVTVTGTDSNNDAAVTILRVDLAFDARGPQTVVVVDQAIVAEAADFSAKLLSYVHGYAVLGQFEDGDTYGWGRIRDTVTLRSVTDLTPAAMRDSAFRGTGGLLSQGSYPVKLLTSELAFGLPYSAVGGWDWACLMLWLREGAQLLAIRNSTPAGTEHSRVGYGLTSQWLGRLSGLDYMGGVGMNSKLAWQIRFLVESEVGA